MTARILDGKRLALEIQAEIAVKVREHQERFARPPSLVAVLVGDDPASQVYVRKKQEACVRVGITSRLIQLPETASSSELLETIEQLNRDPGVDGILVQLPLPRHIDETEILDSVSVWKDVDAFHPENVGRLAQGRPRFLPCTPFGVQQILTRNGISVAGKHVVVLGRSEIVGKPLGLLLMQRGSTLGQGAANATVTICHSQTRDLIEHTRRADVLIAAIGKAHFVTGEMVRPGAIVVDVGVNRIEKRIVGDVHAESVAPIAGYLTPVPGGVGPLTVTMLLANTLHAAGLIAVAGTTQNP